MAEAPCHLLRLMLLAVCLVLIDQADAGESVRIVNQLADTLTLHCQSRDTDLKEHAIAPGQEFYFAFNMNVWMTTDFWCSFHDGIKHQQFDVFQGPGFWGQHDYPCFYCRWEVRYDGFYRSNEVAGAPPPRIIWPWFLQ